MDCARVDAVLNEHGVASLGRAERKALDDHVRACGRCADAWLVHEALTGQPEIEVPAGLFDRVSGAVGERPIAATSAWARRGPIGIGLGLAAAAAVLAGVLFLSPGREAGVDSPGRASPIASPLAGRTFVEGEHYERLPLPAPDVAPGGRIEVAEFFMFGCPHCYDFESFFGPWCEAHADSVDVVRVPVMFNSLSRLHARAFYTAEVLGVEDTLHRELFAELHDRGQRLDSEASLRAFFARFGVSASAFDEAFNSNAVRTRMLVAESLGSRYRISGTPSLVVNGEFLVTPRLSGSFETMLAVVDQLVRRLIVDDEVFVQGDVDVR